MIASRRATGVLFNFCGQIIGLDRSWQGKRFVSLPRGKRLEHGLRVNPILPELQCPPEPEKDTRYCFKSGTETRSLWQMNFKQGA
jgi:hypothetical protein